MDSLDTFPFTEVGLSGRGLSPTFGVDSSVLELSLSNGRGPNNNVVLPAELSQTFTISSGVPLSVLDPADLSLTPPSQQQQQQLQPQQQQQQQQQLPSAHGTGSAASSVFSSALLSSPRLPNPPAYNSYASTSTSSAGPTPAAVATVAVPVQPTQPQRAQRGMACGPCHRAKTACDRGRPCGRCKRLKRESQCVDRKKRVPACARCKKLKTSCDRGRPCGRCVRLKLEGSCVEPKPPSAKRKHPVVAPDHFDVHVTTDGAKRVRRGIGAGRPRTLLTKIEDVRVESSAAALARMASLPLRAPPSNSVVVRPAHLRANLEPDITTQVALSQALRGVLERLLAPSAMLDYTRVAACINHYMSFTYTFVGQKQFDELVQFVESATSLPVCLYNVDFVAQAHPSPLSPLRNGMCCGDQNLLTGSLYEQLQQSGGSAKGSRFRCCPTGVSALTLPTPAQTSVSSVAVRSVSNNKTPTNTPTETKNTAAQPTQVASGTSTAEWPNGCCAGGIGGSGGSARKRKQSDPFDTDSFFHLEVHSRANPNGFCAAPSVFHPSPPHSPSNTDSGAAVSSSNSNGVQGSAMTDSDSSGGPTAVAGFDITNSSLPMAIRNDLREASREMMVSGTLQGEDLPVAVCVFEFPEQPIIPPEHARVLGPMLQLPPSVTASPSSSSSSSSPSHSSDTYSTTSAASASASAMPSGAVPDMFDRLSDIKVNVHFNAEAERLLGYTVPELGRMLLAQPRSQARTGKKPLAMFWRLLCEKDWAKVMKADTECFFGLRDSYRAVVHVIHKTGKLILSMLSCRFHRDAKGQARSIVCCITPLTEDIL